ncbi:MAG: acyl carrier protein [Rickettsiales bacterium]|jgi:acyl carrier protein
MKINDQINSKEELSNIIVDILVKDFECPREKLTPDAQLFTDLDLDSIDAVDLVVKLQQITGKKVDPESFKKVRSLQDVVDAVYSLFSEKKE